MRLKFEELLGEMMMDFKELSSLAALKGILAAIWFWILAMVNYPDSAAKFLFYLCIIDSVLGSFHAWKLDVFRKKKFLSCIQKLALYWVTIVIFIFVDEAVNKVGPNIGKVWPDMPEVALADLVVVYLSANEALSCVEHLEFFGVRFPESLIARIRKYKSNVDAETWDGVDRRQNM